VIVKNGVGLEKWFDDTVESAGSSAVVVDASHGVHIRDDDPHIWHDPLNAVIMATNVAGALEDADSSHAAEYRRNLAGYVAQLHKLDSSIRAQIDTLTNKKLVTNHDSFGYYVDRYGLDFVGSIIPSFDSSAELSARDVETIVARIKAAGVRAVFSETSLPPRTAEAIGKEAGVRVVAGADALYGDSLGPPGSDGDTYIRMEEHNTKVIVDNLG
jgi:zinc/manganese transport system substrate-binding protein/manganese/iron transport system substrate-binding protein